MPFPLPVLGSRYADAAVLRELGLRKTRADDNEIDIVPFQLGARRAARPLQRELRRRVAPAQGLRKLAHNAADIDDRAASLSAHHRYRRLQRRQRAEKIDLKDLPQVVQAQFVDSAVDAHARVVNKNIHGAEMGLSLLDKRPCLALVADVGWNGKDVGAEILPQLSCDPVQQLTAARGESQPATLLRQ